MKNITHLLDVVDQVRDDVALGLMSDPGLSKTSQVKQWAEDNSRQYCELIISQRMPSEISGMPMPVNETQKMEIFDFQTLLELKDGDVLAFDEFTNGNIQTLNACLTLIQERTMLSGHKLPSLVIVAMGNPQGRCDLLPQTKQRFWWVDVKWDARTWTNYMAKRWGFRPASPIIQAITTQYQRGFGDQATYNYMTPRTVENLFRIALNVEKDDPFWEVSDVSHDIVEALYSSIAKTDPFHILQSELIDWININAMKVDSRTLMAPVWATEVLRGIENATTMGELRRFIQQVELTELAPEFIEFMKSNELKAQ